MSDVVHGNNAGNYTLSQITLATFPFTRAYWRNPFFRYLREQWLH
jgi:hypothetical protein